jgi:hypothetical protein
MSTQRCRHGFSLPELLISCLLLTILTGVLAFAWTRGARSWISTSKLSSRLSQLRILRHRVETELIASSSLGLDCREAPAPGILSYPSAYGLKGTVEASTFFRVPAGVSPRWRKYCLYYWIPGDNTVLWKEIPVPAGHAAEQSPTPLSRCKFSAVAQPLDVYATGGKVVAEFVSDFQVRREEQSVQLEWETSEAYHGGTQRKIRISSTTLVRN